MKTLLNAAAVVAMLCTAVATVVAVVFCLAGGANATPAQIRVLKYWMLGLTLLGVTGITVGVFLLRAGQPGWAAGASLLPIAVMAFILTISLLK